MERDTQFAAEFQALRALCDETAPLAERRRLLQSLDHGAFIEPEHQVIFGSIRSLFSRGSISVAQLRLHLNNRGFPDTDVEKYFQPAPLENSSRRTTDKLTT